MSKMKHDAGEVAFAEPPAAPAGVLGFDGRGNVGKTIVAGVVGELLHKAKVPVVLADADPRKTLARRYQGVSVPLSEQPEDSHEWLAGSLNRMNAERHLLLLDLPGGGRALQDFGRDLPLVPFCEMAKARAVSALVLGPNPEDLKHVEDIEAAGHFNPALTFLVLNHGKVEPGRMPVRAFAPVLASPAVERMVERGARIVYVPRLAAPVMALVEGMSVPFLEAEKRLAAIPSKMVEASMLSTWLRMMAEPSWLGPMLDTLREPWA